MNCRKIFILTILPFMMWSCTSYKKSLYLQNDEILENAGNSTLYEYRIMPKDELTITVSTTDPASSVPFFRKIGLAEGQTQSQGMENAKLLNYLVDNDGYIDYPVLGKLEVEGLSTRECEALIRNKLADYLNEVPTVTVRTFNFRISIIGEVKNPGTYTVSDERINIFQALALAGDMTFYSDRDDVQLLREDADGRREVVHLDLTQTDIALSPYYYLQQNDILYVKPLKSRVSSSTFSGNGSIWISLVSLLATIASLVMVSVN